MPELHLVGTLPQDPDGAERLGALLSQLQPDAIAVEGSRAGYERARSRKQPGLKAALEGVLATPGHSAATANFVARLLSADHTHYEQAVASRYATAQAIPLVFLDGDDPGDAGGPGLEPAELGEVEEPIGTADLLALAAHDWRGAFSGDYARARAELEGKACLEFLIPPHEHAAHAARDEGFAAAVARLLEEVAHGRVIVICSLTHLYFSEAFLTLYSQLYAETTARHLTDGVGVLADHAIALPWERMPTR